MVLKPAGLEYAEGIVSTAYNKDATDPRWENDQGIVAYKQFAATILRGKTSCARPRTSKALSPMGCYRE
jgi:hypothetical protein